MGMTSRPGGATPLCTQLNEVYNKVYADANELRERGQRVVVVIATDGESTDGDLAKVLKKFERLPVWIVIRLCTDEDKIVKYYNDIDGKLELEMDVLDDLEGEAKEVCSHNPWLAYGQPLHRAREFGIHNRLFDILDERAFSSIEFKEFCELLLDVELPHPDIDF